MTKNQSAYIKLTAIISMLVDHLGLLFFPQTELYRIVGRIALPLFAYQIGVSYRHTDFSRYLKRLIFSALIFQTTYVLIAIFIPGAELEPWYLNIFFTLTIGLILIRLVDFRQYLAGVFILLIPPVLGYLGVTVDYGVYGVVMILGLFLFQQNKVRLMLFLASHTFLFCFIIEKGASYRQMFCLLALPFIIKPLSLPFNIPKWFFYVFYPAHLVILYGVKILVDYF